MAIDDVTFSVHDEIAREIAAAVDAGLDEANCAAAPLHEVRPIGCVARLADGTLVGGAIGRTWGSFCEVQQLWVRPDCRRRGIGSRLMRQLHAAAEQRGCTVFYLETFSFQSPRLYQSLGYEVRLEIRGFGEGIVKYHMIRSV